MKNFLEKILCIIIVLGLSAGGCNNDEEFLEVEIVDLDPNSPFVPTDALPPTHYYVKWLTTNDDDINKLEGHRSTNALYAYPLHENITFFGADGYYKAREHYSIVPIGAPIFAETGIEHYKLTELHLPIGVFQFKDGKDFIEIKGTITVEDDLDTTHGSNTAKDFYKILRGIDVRIRLFDFAVYRSTTDQEGKYSIKIPAATYFKTIANSSALSKIVARVNIFYQTDDLSVRTEELLTLAHGPDDVKFDIDIETLDSDNGTNFKIITKDVKIPLQTENTDYESTISPHAMLAHAYRAGYVYFHGDVGGILRPSSKHPVYVRTTPTYDGETGVYNNTGNIGVRGAHIFAGTNAFHGQPSVPADIYSITWHELAHSAHARMEEINNLDFTNTDGQLKESWATGIQIIFTRKVYPGYEFWNAYNSDYSAIVVDLVDGTKDNPGGLLRVNGGSGTVDRVYGYSLKTLEDALHDALNLDKWIENILENVTSPLEKRKINEILDFWKKATRTS